MEKFGLIGKTLKHSYSKIIHQKLGDYSYELYELESEEIKDFIATDVTGFNVTIPYKKELMPYLDSIDEKATSIGAVNTVIKRGGGLIGYNTDFDGMCYMLSRAKITVKDKNVLILGTGGTANTATAVCKHNGAKKIVTVSRQGKVNYGNYFEQKDAQIIINTTPVGMYPLVGESPIDLKVFLDLEGVVDAIYNPAMTKLLFDAKDLGVKFTNGLPMLVAQAKYAMEIFLNQKKDDSVIEKVTKEIESETLNVVLIGMAGAGKSTIGREIAKRLDREFIDTDEQIIIRDGRDIPTIFAESGEEYFREIERTVISEIGKLKGLVIATGGGIVKDFANYRPLKQNGIIFNLQRDLKNLATGGRPLYRDADAVEKLYKERKPLYVKFADYTVSNDKGIEQTVEGVMEKL